MVYSLNILGKKIYVVSASNFLKFVSNIFAMLNIFYKQSRGGGGGGGGLVLKVVYDFK